MLNFSEDREVILIFQLDGCKKKQPMGKPGGL